MENRLHYSWKLESLCCRPSQPLGKETSAWVTQSDVRVGKYIQVSFHRGNFASTSITGESKGFELETKAVVQGYSHGAQKDELPSLKTHPPPGPHRRSGEWWCFLYALPPGHQDVTHTDTITTEFECKASFVFNPLGGIWTKYSHTM